MSAVDVVLMSAWSAKTSVPLVMVEHPAAEADNDVLSDSTRELIVAAVACHRNGLVKRGGCRSPAAARLIHPAREWR